MTIADPISGETENNLLPIEVSDYIGKMLPPEVVNQLLEPFEDVDRNHYRLGDWETNHDAYVDEDKNLFSFDIAVFDDTDFYNINIIMLKTGIEKRTLTLSSRSKFNTLLTYLVCEDIPGFLFIQPSDQNPNVELP